MDGYRCGVATVRHDRHDERDTWYLKDSTGARHFWPVRVQRFDWIGAAARSRRNCGLRPPYARQRGEASGSRRNCGRRLAISKNDGGIDEMENVPSPVYTDEGAIAVDALWGALGVQASQLNNRHADRVAAILQRRGSPRRRSAAEGKPRGTWLRVPAVPSTFRPPPFISVFQPFQAFRAVDRRAGTMTRDKSSWRTERPERSERTCFPARNVQVVGTQGRNDSEHCCGAGAPPPNPRLDLAPRFDGASCTIRRSTTIDSADSLGGRVLADDMAVGARCSRSRRDRRSRNQHERAVAVSPKAALWRIRCRETKARRDRRNLGIPPRAQRH